MKLFSRAHLAVWSILLTNVAYAQNANLPGVSVNFGQGTNLVDTMEVLLLFTVLTMAPAIIILCTSFTRIVVVLSFMRQALGTQNMPPNQLLIGFALFLSIFVMMPTGQYLRVCSRAFDYVRIVLSCRRRPMRTYEVRNKCSTSSYVQKQTANVRDSMACICMVLYSYFLS